MRALLALALIASPLPAAAFAIKTTSMGAEVRWTTPHVRLGVLLTGDAARDRLLQRATRLAAAAWSSTGEVDITVEVTDEVARMGWEEGSPAANVVAWAEGDWTHDEDMLALTFLHYATDTGDILDADILVNDEAYRWTDADEAPRDGDYDLANALTHELGHALGLGHSEVLAATMYPSSSSMEISKRDLDADDEEGLRAIYAAVEDPTVTETLIMTSPYGCQDTPGDTPWIVLVSVLVALAYAPHHTRRRALARAVAVVALVTSISVLRRAEASQDGPPLEQIVRRADAIADVVVSAQHVEIQGGLRVTVSELAVLRCRAGWCPRTLVLEQLGGEKDGIGLVAEGITPVKVGDALAIAARVRGTRWRLVGRDHGVLLDLRRADPVARARLEQLVRVAR